MKKEVIDHMVDSFIDFQGVERKFIIVAVSTPEIYLIHKEDKLINVSEKVLHLGFAICNPADEFNEEVGLKIAISKALNNDTGMKLYATHSGMINTVMVRALMRQEIEYFKANPASHITWYNDAKHAYEDAKIKAAEEANLPDEQKMLIKNLKELPNEDLERIIKLINA